MEWRIISSICCQGEQAPLKHTSATWTRLYFRIFGIVYGVVTVIGSLQGTTVLGSIPVNLVDTLLHLVLTVLLLGVGFGLPRSNEEHTAAIA